MPYRDLDANDSCAHWEEALTDLLDGTLAPEQQLAFARHARGCTACETLLRECGEGREWVGVLHGAPPAVPGDLPGKILARTAADVLPGLAAGTPGIDGMAVALPSYLWASRGQRQARILMTAAMAVFSIGLTLSTTGTRLGDVRTAMENPAALEVSAFRRFFDTKKQVVSLYDNLRLVREVEATVRDLRQSSGMTQPPRKVEHPQPSARLPLAGAVPLQAFVASSTENSFHGEAL